MKKCREKFRIPRVLTAKWNAFGDWSNVEIYRRGRFELRRLDVLLLFFGIVCVGYYWSTAGWQGALMGGAMYLLVLLSALWIL